MNKGYTAFLNHKLQIHKVLTPVVVTDYVYALMKHCPEVEREEAQRIVTYVFRQAVKKNKIQKIVKGYYTKFIQTRFGAYPTFHEKSVYSYRLLNEGNQTAGYETVPSVLNKVGLDSWLTRRTYIKTNHYRLSQPVHSTTVAVKPEIKVNTQNYAYLLLLDIADAIANNKYHIDCENVNGWIKKYIKARKISIDTLKDIARQTRKTANVKAANFVAEAVGR